jgi:hypothetical protein
MDIEPTDAARSLNDTLSPGGWTFDQQPGRVIARKHDWPTQLHVLIDFGSDGDAALALVLDMRTMPLGGERFRDLFNTDREQSLRGFGNFRVRQLLASGGWASDVSDSAFLYGATTGISRAARLVFFDRHPVERGSALVKRFIVENHRFAETGDQIASILQRLYQRTVLGSPTASVALPRLAPAMSHVPYGIIETYPWRF